MSWNLFLKKADRELTEISLLCLLGAEIKDMSHHSPARLACFFTIFVSPPFIWKVVIVDIPKPALSAILPVFPLCSQLSMMINGILNVRLGRATNKLTSGGKITPPFHSDSFTENRVALKE